MNATGKARHSTILLVTATWLLAYFPVTSFILGVKNDLFTSYLPPKFFLSESLKAGEFPLWNPFINYGFPMYGDMSMSYWNPSTWIFGILGYNAYTLTLELILFMLLGGFGMYLLSGIWIRNREYRRSAALLYMCSGFVTGHLQHFNWINAAGLLPFCIFFYWKFLHEREPKYFLGSAFFLAFWCTAAHPGYIIGMIYFLTALTIFTIARSDNRSSAAVRPIRLILLLILILAGPAMGYFEVVPSTNRSGPMVPDLANGVTDPGSWISFIFPFASTSSTGFMTNDIAMRNCYIGLLPLASLFLLFRKAAGYPLFFFVSGLFFLLLSTSHAGPVYTRLPLINFVRLPGEFMLFTACFLILCGMILVDRNQDPKSITKILRAFSWLILTAITVAAYMIFIRKMSFLYADLPVQGSLREYVRQALPRVSIADKMLLQGLVHLFLIQAYIRILGKRSHFPLGVLVAIECIVVTLPNIPYTGVGKRTVSEINAIISRSPKGPQLPYTRPESEVTMEYPDTDSVVNNWAFYSKAPALSKPLSYPLILDGASAYFDSGDHDRSFGKPFAMFNGQGSPEPSGQTYRQFGFSTRNNRTDTMTIKQVAYNGWRAAIDGKQVPLLRHTRMVSVEVPSGNHRVELYFSNPWVKWALIIHLAVMIILAAWLSRYLIRYIFP